MKAELLQEPNAKPPETDDGTKIFVSLDKKRSLVDTLETIYQNEPEATTRDARIEQILSENPVKALELFRESWRVYMLHQMEAGRDYQNLFRRIVEFNRDIPGPDPDDINAPDKPVNEKFYDYLYNVAVRLKGIPEVERIIRGVVKEFRSWKPEPKLEEGLKA